jgi:hypothetical protein
MVDYQPQQTPRKKKGPSTGKPEQPPSGPRVDPSDPVEEASNESFPASDPPSFSPSRARPPYKGPQKP